jgi:hypothetical protein
MRTRHRPLLIVPMVLITLACTCNMLSMSTATPAPEQGVVPTLAAQPNPTIAPSTQPALQPPATECQPRVTATKNVNVRKGPSTNYDIVDALSAGESAIVEGKSEAQYGEWWYIVKSNAPGGHGWVWGEAVTPSCIPDNLQVVVAPPTPKTQAGGGQPMQATETSLPPPAGGGSWGPTQVDLAVTDLFTDNWPLGEIYVRVTNNGPGSLSDVGNNLLQFAIIVHPYSGAPQNVQGPSTTLTLSLIPGETKAYRTYISVDGVNNWYEISCELVPVTADPVPGNNTYSEMFPPPP